MGVLFSVLLHPDTKTCLNPAAPVRPWSDSDPPAAGSGPGPAGSGLRGTDWPPCPPPDSAPAAGLCRGPGGGRGAPGPGGPPRWTTPGHWSYLTETAAGRQGGG